MLNPLIHSGIKHIDDLREINPMKIRNYGPKAAERLRDFAARHGVEMEWKNEGKN